MLKPKPDALKDLLAIQQQINKLFEDRLQQGGGPAFPAGTLPPSARAGAWQPPVDAWETGDGFVVQVELPGVSPDDVTVAIEDRSLQVRGERKKPAESGVRSFHRMEREHGTFTRAFTLPKGVATFDVETSWQDGVLQVTLSKNAAKPPSKKKK